MNSQPPPRPSSKPPEGASGDSVRYSVQINQTPGSLCVACKTNPSAEGPVGYFNNAPVCDICLLLGAKELGMLVALAVLVRAFADDDANSPPAESDESLSLLVLFARIYDRQASWPRRNEFSDDLTGDDLTSDGPHGDNLDPAADPKKDPGLH